MDFHKIVDKVVFDKHPSFRVRTEVCRPQIGKYGVGITCVAWGYFDVTYTVHFHKKLGLTPL